MSDTEDGGFILNLGFEAPFVPKPRSSGPGGTSEKSAGRRDSYAPDADYTGGGGPASASLSKVQQQPVVLVQRKRAAAAPDAAGTGPTPFTFGFISAPAQGAPAPSRPGPLGASGKQSAGPQQRPSGPKFQPLRGNDEARPGGKWTGVKAKTEKPVRQREARPPAKQRPAGAAGALEVDADEELDKAEIDEDGRGAILDLVLRAARRDQELEAGRGPAGGGEGKGEGKAGAAKKKPVEEGGQPQGIVSFDAEGDAAGGEAANGRAKQRRPLPKNADLSRFDDPTSSSEGEEGSDGGADTDSDGDEDAARGGVRAAYGRDMDPARGAPSTSGRQAFALAAAKAEEKGRLRKKEEKKASRRNMESGSRVAHRAGELVQAGPLPEGEVGEGADGVGEDDPWRALGLATTLAAHLKSLNFVAPTKIQRLAIPALLSGRDCLVNAPTGSGKTLAYLAPIVHDLQSIEPRISRADGTHAIIVSPTRELSIQISDVLTLLVRRYVWLVGGAIMGGENRNKEKARLRKGVTVLVGSPGRLMDHLQSTKAFRTDELRWLVLDEADRLLDLGFEAKLKEIVDLLDGRLVDAGAGGRYRRALLSATLHSRLATLAAVSLTKPLSVGFKVAVDREGGLKIEGDAEGGAEGEEGAEGEDAIVMAGGFRIPKQLKQSFLTVPAKLRLPSLVGLLRTRCMGKKGASAKVVVFMSSCDGVEFHYRVLNEMPAHAAPNNRRGKRDADFSDDEDEEDETLAPSDPLLSVPIFKLHGNMIQSQRTSTFFEFARCQAGVLLCTDVAARGLDFPAVTTIIQFDPPGEPAEYVHRVGRTARLGKEGEAIIFLMPTEHEYVTLLHSNAVTVEEQPLSPILQALPSKPRPMRPGRAAAAGADEDHRSGPVGEFQYRCGRFVGSQDTLKRLAADAFRSYVRAYAVHPASVRSIFHVKKLHLGHVAGSFGLKDTPSLLGSSAAKVELAKRKRDAEDKKRDKQRKKAKHVQREQDYNVTKTKKS